ncbi:hypothetical protein N7475_005466 [Penicillium sp. IBT 31633x]|nr:hypothetical protein N7475_005466 [Penicillium sp. IBT 31633x]
MSYNKKLVLLTGATGFIGFQTLIDALKAGFRVRCAVRSPQCGEGGSSVVQTSIATTATHPRAPGATSGGCGYQT